MSAHDEKKHQEHTEHWQDEVLCLLVQLVELNRKAVRELDRIRLALEKDSPGEAVAFDSTVSNPQPEKSKP